MGPKWKYLLRLSHFYLVPLSIVIVQSTSFSLSTWHSGSASGPNSGLLTSLHLMNVASRLRVNMKWGNIYYFLSLWIILIFESNSQSVQNLNVMYKRTLVQQALLNINQCFWHLRIQISNVLHIPKNYMFIYQFYLMCIYF